MSTNNYYNFGTINNDHSKHVTIDARGANVADIIRAAFAEDITPSEDFSSVTPESDSGKQLFCRITKAAYDKGVAQQVEDDLRSASVSAPKLCKAIKLNEALSYLDTKDLQSTELFDLLNEHYHLPFKLRTFQDCRSK